MRFGLQIKTSPPQEMKHFFVYFAYYKSEIDLGCLFLIPLPCLAT